jgi:hypothetical protein
VKNCSKRKENQEEQRFFDRGTRIENDENKKIVEEKVENPTLMTIQIGIGGYRL